MTLQPPPLRSMPPRRFASGRMARLIVPTLLLVAGAACSTAPPPPRASPTGSPPGSAPGLRDGASARLANQDGLLVAAGGPLRIVTADGAIGAFDHSSAPVVQVSSGGGVVIVVDPAFRARLGTTSGSDRRAWRPFALPTDGRAERPLLAVSPDGATVAVAAGPVQARTFDLILIDVADGTRRSIAVDRALNGPPAWLGVGSIAINVLGPDQHAVLDVVDTATGEVRALPTYGSSIAASSDGSLVAIDDSASGEVLVGTRATLDAGDPAVMARIPNPAGFASEAMALSDDGTRLAIAWRSDRATSLEVLAHVDGAWMRGTPVAFGANAVLSIAWLR
ncbi:MAG TPA: hypothetical protein VM427_07610 [Patescibacteria group bacterium]|nr:hypothetical protein [Patescibacteria group bacterium]